MEDCLRNWLRSACETLTNPNEVETMSEVERIRVVGAYIFDLNPDCSFEDIKSEINASLEFEINHLDSAIILMEASLVCAVSPKCSHRAEFVQQIISMDHVAQSFLMQAIQNNMLLYRSTEPSLTESPLKQQEDIFSPIRNNIQSPKHSNWLCQQCQIKERDINNAKEDLSKAIKLHEKEQQHSKYEIIELTKRIAEAELSILNKDTILSQKQSEIDLSIVKIDDLTQKLAQHHATILQVAVLKDEIDVLRTKTEHTEMIEIQLEKLREKLEEFSSMKQQLKIESSAHSETHSKLLSAELEIESLKKSKSQLEDYRGLYTESLIKIDQLTLRLQQKEELLQSLNQQKVNTSDVQNNYLQQTQRLTEELTEAREKLREFQRNGGGLGEGLCELNPSLMKEMNRLRTENKELLNKLDQSSLQSLESLQKHLSEQQSMTSSLQCKWMATKDQLTESNHKIVTLSNEIDSLNVELSNLHTTHLQYQKQVQESYYMSQEDNDNKHINNVRIQKHLHRFHQHAMSLVLLGKHTLLNEYQSALTEKQADLEDCHSEISSLTSLNNDLTSNLASSNQQVVDIKNEITLLYQSHNEKLQQLGIDHQNNSNQILQLEESKRNELIARYEASLSAEAESLKIVNEEIEEERIKRRKLEREKKFYEAESHRFRSQLQQAGVSENGSNISGSSMQVLDNAIKELRSMEQELDDAKSELQRLRIPPPPPPYSGQCDSGSDAASGGASTIPCQLPRGPSSSSSGPMRVINRPRDIHAGASYGSYLERSDLTDKRLEQMTKERREMIAKALEEGKEKMELSQKLLVSEREITSLKAKITKLTLEKERIERKIARDHQPYGDTTSISKTFNDQAENTLNASLDVKGVVGSGVSSSEAIRGGLPRKVFGEW